VKLHANPTYEQVFAVMGEHFFHGVGDAVVCTPSLAHLEDEWRSNYQTMYNTAAEDMQRGIGDAEGGGYWLNYIRPKLERKYRVKPPEKSGWDVKFEFHGRSSGWLSLEQFEGINFRNITCSVDHEFMDLEDDDKSTYRRKLCAYLEEISLLTRRDALDRELTYQLAFQMHLLVEQQQERRRA
jgi:hypothetical protein